MSELILVTRRRTSPHIRLISAGRLFRAVKSEMDVPMQSVGNRPRRALWSNVVETFACCRHPTLSRAASRLQD